MSKSKVFVFALLGFIIGIGLGSKWQIETEIIFASLGILILILALGSTSKTFGFKILAFLALFFIFAVLGFWRANSKLLIKNEFTNWLGTQVEFEGIIVDDVDIRSQRQQITVRPQGSNQNILITETNRVQYFYGNEVWVKGKVLEPTNFDEFDYKGYLESKNVYAVMRYPKLITLHQHRGNWLLEQLLRFKSWVVAKVSKNLVSPASDLLLGILIGAKQGLPNGLVKNFQTTGTSHIIAVSGYNISIIISSLGVLAYLFGRKKSYYVTGLIILLFVFIAGPSASVVRAAVMGGLLIFAMTIGRPYSVSPALYFSAAFMLLINPRLLLWDVGFMLSFAATLGIVYGSPILEIWMEQLPKYFGLKQLLIITFCANITTLPIILFFFGNLSLISPLANMFVLPLIPIIMFLGFGCLLPFLGPGFAFLVKFALNYVIYCVNKFAELPFSAISININATTFWSLILLIVCLYFLVTWKTEEKNKLQIF